jgi:type IV pilus assembly protein PilB
MAQKIGELLVKEQLITSEQLNQAIEEQKSKGGRLGANLAKLGILGEDKLISFLSKKYRVPAINLDEFEVSQDIISLVSNEVAKKHMVIPVNRSAATLIVAMTDPSDMFALDDLKFLTGYNISPVIASEEAIGKAIEKYYGTTVQVDQGESQKELESTMDEVLNDFKDEDYEVIGGDGDVDAKELAKVSQQAPIVKLVNSILIDAINKKASDIHVECYDKAFRIRLRIDGNLYETWKPALKLKNAIISRLKIMAEMDIAERRLPQDGRIKIKIGKDKEMDFRVNSLPTLFGEKIVMRLLDKGNLQLDMTKLGFEEAQLKLFKDAIYMPYGMVLVTGPTGSGKTTTLYSAIAELNKTTTNITTAEDPVEYNLEGINQVQMQDDIGFNFATALRSFLRQDPNVILVGEIRDFETAEIAIKAALTGQVVLSTLHTNDAASSITRLINMGIEPFLVSSALNLIQAQRLVRKLCQGCKEPIEVPKKTLLEMGLAPQLAETAVVSKGKGCPTCNNLGYKGRIAIYEILPLTEEVRAAVIEGASDIEIKKIAVKQGMKSLRQSALQKMLDGVTTLDEVVGATAADE